ncbi:unnamed protein product [Brassica rapa subsp. trilocularis]
MFYGGLTANFFKRQRNQSKHKKRKKPKRRRTNTTVLSLWMHIFLTVLTSNQLKT